MGKGAWEGHNFVMMGKIGEGQIFFSVLFPEKLFDLKIQ